MSKPFIPAGHVACPECAVRVAVYRDQVGQAVRCRECRTWWQFVIEPSGVMRLVTASVDREEAS